MHIIVKTVLILAAGALSTIGSVRAQASTSAGAEVSGKSLYAIHCASCHGASLRGGEFAPALTKARFNEKWASHQSELLSYMLLKMPPAAPGSLSPADYRALLTYISAANGWPDATLGSAAPASGSAVVPSDVVAGGPRSPVQSAAPEVFRDNTPYAQAVAGRRHLLDGLTPVTDHMLNAPPDGDWLTWRRTQETLSFSPLRQIRRQNVSRLAVAWAWSLPAGPNEIAPLVHDGILFVTSGAEVQALDAATGTLLWRYVRETAPQYRSTMNELHRNFAIYGDNLYLATADRHVVALAARTGDVVWDHEIVPPNLPAIFLTSGPFVANGKILQGTSDGQACKGGCFIVGLDAGTGQEIWRFQTVAQPGQPGDDSWNGTPLALRNGGAVWVPGSYDPLLNLVYFGTAQTYEAGNLLLNPKGGSPGGGNDGLYTDSTIALNPDTGKLIWYHQHLQRDVWDLDEAFERLLITLPIDGKPRNLIITTGKIGIVDALDRATGDYVFSKDLGLTNIVTGIDPRTGRRTYDPMLTPVPDKKLTVCPSAEGARNWMTTAYNPATRILYLPLEETCMNFLWQPDYSTDPAEHGLDMSWTVMPRPHSDGNYARLDAVDMMTRKPLWSMRYRAPFSSSLLTTAGGIVFNGNRDRMFRAANDRTGKTLWEIRLNAVPNASPISYGVNGRQFVAIVAGGGGPHDSETQQFTPEIENSTASTTLWVFSLPPSN